MTKNRPVTSRILVVDDDPVVRNLVVRCLGDADFEVFTAEDADEAMRILAAEDIVLAIIDLIMPGTDGLTLTRDIKASRDIGIIILSGRGEPLERIIGLEVGADDYVAKPFEPRELLARVRSVLRRLPKAGGSQRESDSVPEAVFVFDRWRLDVAARSLTAEDGEAVELTSGEFDLLRALAEHPNRVLSRDQLMDYLHGDRPGSLT